MQHEYAQQPRDIVVLDEEDSIEAVQPTLRSAALPRRDAHGLFTPCRHRQREATSPPPSSDLERLSSIPKKSVVSTSTEISFCSTPGAAYYNTGRRQPWISQDEPSWRFESNSTHVPLYTPTTPEDKVGDTRHVPEALDKKPRSHFTYKDSKETITIDLDTDDESEVSTSMSAVMIEDDRRKQKRSPASVPGLELLEPIYETLERISSDNRTLKAGKTVEMLDEDFLRIQSVVRDISTTEIFLRGHRLRRAKNLEGLLELKLNEVVMVLEVEESDPRPVMVQGIKQVPLAQVGRIRELVVTNRPFPELSFRESAHKRPADGEVANYGRLVCRWKYIISSQTLGNKWWNKYSEKCLTRFQQSEIDFGSAVDDDLLRQHWRGDTIKGGASLDMPAEEEDFDEKERVVFRPNQAPSTGRKSNKTVTETASSSEILPPLMSSSAPIGNRQHPFTVLDHEAKALPDWVAESQRQAAHDQIVIDITGDESPKISLNPLSLDGNRGQSSKRRRSHDDGILQPSWHHNPQLQNTGAASSPDIIEITAQVKAKSTSGLYTPYLQSTKRLKTTDQETAMPLIMSPTNSSSGPGRGQRPASARSTDQIQSSGVTLMESEQKTSAQATAISGVTGKQSLTQRALSRQDPPSTKPRQKQRYTFGDAFCGAGGTSRGAKSAGFRVEWGFDFDFAAITSYSLNFYNTECIAAWAHQFAEIGDEHRVDVLHLSPPCQVFSPAHTVNGKDDEMNTATFFAVEELVKRIKPRVVTLENTSGLPILHPLWLNSAIHIFTRLGFSVRWKIMNFAEYGLVQARKRLIIIASCLGERLPVFPKPTHGTRLSGLAPLVTVQDVISRIPQGFANHDPESARERNEPPYRADQVLRACITCSGGGNYHPSGKRDFTLREYACLQGFPLEHKFGLTRVKKQIGNAVPPMFAKVLFEEIKNTLLKADGF